MTDVGKINNAANFHPYKKIPFRLHLLRNPIRFEAINKIMFINSQSRSIKSSLQQCSGA